MATPVLTPADLTKQTRARLARNIQAAMDNYIWSLTPDAEQFCDANGIRRDSIAASMLRVADEKLAYLQAIERAVTDRA